ncbi:glucose-induced degradation protein 4 homolog [Halichondria panicea]|uniref:glucose-induced degradation protein 4 homolog n=1 Tax=Halichondria panicea TaxID=6063 RepID=UPI00312B5FFD
MPGILGGTGDPVTSCDGAGPQSGFPTTALHSGSRFTGHQQSKGNKYHVEVNFKHVDYKNSTVCGYLKIQGLTEEYPTLTTFFEGEIISARYPFLTRKWDAHEDVDRKHWSKFPAFGPFIKTFNSDDFSYSQLEETNSVFMRWKEHFLVPDHNIKDISGASFSGFYYICFQSSKGTIDGYYYHKSSEWYQSISLQHIPEETVSVFQFH